MPERLWIREVLRHDPCAASGSVASGAVWRWLVLVGRGDRMSDSLELPWRDGVAVGPEERRNARSRGLDPGSEDEWSIEGLDGSCLEEWAQARYDQVLERAEGSDSALLEAISPRSAMLRRSRAGAEVLVDLRQGRLSRPSRTGACP